jgi:hypothetical protein
MIVHCRFGKGSVNFLKYCDIVAAGNSFEAFYRPDWYSFKSQFLGNNITRPYYPNPGAADLLQQLFTEEVL